MHRMCGARAIGTNKPAASAAMAILPGLGRRHNSTRPRRRQWPEHLAPMHDTRLHRLQRAQSCGARRPWRSRRAGSAGAPAVYACASAAAAAAACCASTPAAAADACMEGMHASMRSSTGSKAAGGVAVRRRCMALQGREVWRGDILRPLNGCEDTVVAGSGDGSLGRGGYTLYFGGRAIGVLPRSPAQRQHESVAAYIRLVSENPDYAFCMIVSVSVHTDACRGMHMFIRSHLNSLVRLYSTCKSVMAVCTVYMARSHIKAPAIIGWSAGKFAAMAHLSGQRQLQG